MTKAQQLLQFVIRSGRMADLIKEASRQPRPYVIVIADLTGPKQIGETLAQTLNPQDFQQRTPDQDVWTWLEPLDRWQGLRTRITGHPDDFGPIDGQRFAVVTDDELYQGAMKRLRDAEMVWH